MIRFDDLPLDSGTKLLLSKLNIDFAFQPIYRLDTNELFAYEALMRPVAMTPIELIEDYTCRNKLHILELATFFGATKAFYLRHYNTKLFINSFSTEYLNSVESSIFFDIFPKDIVEKLVIEISDHSRVAPMTWAQKKQLLKPHNVKFALDNFGTEPSDIDSINVFDPYIVKLDSSLIRNVDNSLTKQHQLAKLMNYLHSRDILVLALGVETKEELDYLKSINIDMAQGFYFGKPE